MYEDPSFAVALRQQALRAEADRYRLRALVQCCRQSLRSRESLRRRIAERVARLRTRPVPCTTC
jgi:hypothetical protein